VEAGADAVPAQLAPGESRQNDAEAAHCNQHAECSGLWVHLVAAETTADFRQLSNRALTGAAVRVLCVELLALRLSSLVWLGKVELCGLCAQPCIGLAVLTVVLFGFWNMVPIPLEFIYGLWVVPRMLCLKGVPVGVTAEGAVQVIAVYTAQTALFKTINLFAPEKQLVQAERTKGSYGAAPYFISKVLADLPVSALYPFLFSCIIYPMTNLQPKVLLSTAFVATCCCSRKNCLLQCLSFAPGDYLLFFMQRHVWLHAVAKHLVTTL
jgi:hypothetical protein